MRVAIAPAVDAGLAELMADSSTSGTRNLASIREEEIAACLKGLDLDSFEQLVVNPGFRRRHLVTLLRDMSLSASILQRISDDEDLLADYRVKSAMALHPHTPKVVALSLVRHLFWRDLLLVIESLRVHAQVRRTAEYLLSEQLPDLTLGERMALCRLAGRSVIRMLRTEDDARIAKVLLENSRLTEEDVVFMSSRSGARPDVLRAIGRSPRWKARPAVKLALVRNTGTPPAVSLGLISGLRESDLQGLVNSPSVPYVVRRTAERILSEGRGRQ